MSHLNTNTESAARAAVVPDILDGFEEANEIARMLNIRRDTLSRMTANPELMFPSPVVVGRKFYYHRGAVRRWLCSQAGVASDE